MPFERVWGFLLASGDTQLVLVGINRGSHIAAGISTLQAAWCSGRRLASVVVDGDHACDALVSFPRRGNGAGEVLLPMKSDSTGTGRR